MKIKYLVVMTLLAFALIVLPSTAAVVNITPTSYFAVDADSTTYPSIRAVDYDPSTFWSSVSSGTWGFYGIYNSSGAVAVNYSVQARSDSAVVAPTAWNFLGSRDNSTYYLLDKRTGVTWVAGQNNYYNSFTEASNRSTYNYFKIMVTNNNGYGSPGEQVAEFRVYNTSLLYSSTFVANQTQAVSPFGVNFNASASGASLIPDSYTFWPGDGTSTTTGWPNFNVTYYGNSTKYTPMLVTSLAGFNDSVTKSTDLIVALPKIANWIQPAGSLPTEHIYQPITLQTTSNFTFTPGTTNIWTFDNGTVPWTQTGDTTYWNFTKTGTYTLSLNTTNQYGSNTTIVQNYITLVDLETPTELITSNIQYTNTYPLTVTFNDTGSEDHVSNWLWSWGDGNQYATTFAGFKNRTYTYNSTGTFQVSLTKTNLLTTTTNSTPADYININMGQPVVYPTNTYTNRNLTGMFSIAAQNVSRADDLSMYIAYNFTEINITSMNMNSSILSIYPTATLNAGWSSPGTIRFNLTGKDMTAITTTPVVDIHYLVKDMTNYSATYGYPWQPISVSAPGSGTIYAIGNKTLYGSTYGAYAPTNGIPGALFFTNMTFSKLIKFYNNVNNQKISGQTITVQWIPTSGQGSAGSATTNTGEYTISSSYDPGMSVTGQATGYYNGTATYVWSNTNSESQFLTPLSGASGSTVWYTPKQVRFKVVDGNNNPLPYSTVTASFIASTLPSTDPNWLQTAYGIARSVATDMLSSSVAMTGICGQDGYVTFTMHGSLDYNISVTNTTSGIYGWYQQVYPMDNEYLLRVSNNYAQTQVAASSYTAVQNTSLWARAIDPNTVRLGLNFTDTTGQSTNVKFMVWDAINGTVYYSTMSAAPGTATYQPFYDLPNIRGNKYLWNYTATRG